MNLIAMGTIASAAAGAMTVIGALPVLFGRRVSIRTQDAFLKIAAGVMLAASFFSLTIPAIEASGRLYCGRYVPAAIAAAGLLIGAAAMGLGNELFRTGTFSRAAGGRREDREGSSGGTRPVVNPRR